MAELGGCTAWGIWTLAMMTGRSLTISQVQVVSQGNDSYWRMSNINKSSGLLAVQPMELKGSAGANVARKKGVLAGC